MSHRGELRFDEEVKEPLVDALDAQLEQAGVQPVHARVNSIGRQGKQLSIKLSEQSDGANLELHSEHTLRAHNVVIAIGRSGDYRRLNIPGEELPKVSNRLHDAKEFAGKQVTVVGGCDSALETAIALTIAGADVTLSYRGAEFARAKPANVEKINELLANPSAPVGLEQPSLGRVTSALTQDMLDTPRSIGSLIIHYRTNITKIDPNSLTLRHDDGRVDTLENDFVFTMIGREAPLNFFAKVASRYPAIGMAVLTFRSFLSWPCSHSSTNGRRVEHGFQSMSTLPKINGSHSGSMIGGQINLVTAAHCLAPCISA